MSGESGSSVRDDQIAALLRELDVPEHRPGFEDDLRRRLVKEQQRRAAARRRGLRRRIGLRVAAAAAVAATALVVFDLAGGDRGEPGVATAAAVKQRVRTALAELRTLSGVLVSKGPGPGDESRWTFTLARNGDFRLSGPTRGEVITYDAADGVVRSAQRSSSLGGGALFYAVRRGVAPGPPDQGPPTWLLPEQVGAYVRALLAAGDPRVHEIRYESRPAWRVVVDAEPNAIVPEFSGDGFEITVDRETGIPVRVREMKQGAVLREIRIEHLAVNAPLPAGVFQLAFPSGADVLRSDDGFRPVELGQVAGVVGYAPLVPSWVPDGYRLAQVAVATRSGPTGAEAGNPPSRMVVSLLYRRGLDSFLVTSRASGGADATWSDPLASGEGYVDRPERVTIGEGALRGTTADLVIGPRAFPHLWARTDRLVVTVGGDLGRSELVRIAESLQGRP
jgi:hypothetical protein